MATPEQLANAAKLVESEKAYQKELKKTQKLRDDMAEFAGNLYTIEENLIEIEKQRNTALDEQQLKQDDILTARRALRDAQKEIVDLQQQYNNLAEDTAPLEQERARVAIKNAQDTANIARGKLDTAEDELITAKKILAEKERMKKVLQANLDLEEKYGKEVEKNLEKAEEGNQRLQDATSKVAKSIPGIGGALSKGLDVKKKTLDFATDLNKLGAEMGEGSSFGKGLMGASSKLTNFVKSIGMATLAGVGFLVMLAKMGLDVNNLSKALGASTGFGDKFNGTITKMGEAGHMAGIGFKESAAAIGALTEGLSSFNPNAERTNAEIGLTVARLEKLGVSSAASVKSMDHMQRAMGMTAKQSADATAQLARMGKEIGITGTKMINDFNAASARLAIYGKQSIKVFKELAAQAKATGIEMNSLINISQKFDQFDTAADSAAKLNAVLGTQLSTIEMMNATDSERIMILRQEVQASVGNFDSLDKFTKQYIAQAMGVASVDEAQRLLNMSTAEYQKYKDGQKESADIQQEMADATEAAVPVFQQLKLAALQLFMAFAPVIELFADMMKFIGPVIGFFAKIINFAAPIIAALAPVALIIAKMAGTIASIGAVINPWVLGIIAIVGAFTLLYRLFKKKINPDFGQIFHYLGEGLMKMFNPLSVVQKGVGTLTGAFKGLFGTAKKDAASLTEGGFDIKAMADIDTTKIAAGFREIKSAVMELSDVRVEGMLAFQSDGAKTTMMMGSVATEMAMLLSGGKLEVDIKMPEMAMPDISVKVYIGDRELRDIIRTETKYVMGRAG